MHNALNTLLTEGLHKLYEFNPNEKIHLVTLEKQPENRAQIVQVRDVRKPQCMLWDLVAKPTAMDLVHLEIIKANMALNKEYPIPRLVINKNYSRQSKRFSRFKLKMFLIISLLILLFIAMLVLYFRYFAQSRIEKPRKTFSKKMLEILSVIFLF